MELGREYFVQARLEEQERIAVEREKVNKHMRERFSSALPKHVFRRLDHLKYWKLPSQFKLERTLPMRGRYPHIQALSDHSAVISSEGDDLDLFDIITGENIVTRRSGNRTMTAMSMLNDHNIVFATKSLGAITTSYKLLVFDSVRKILVADTDIDFLAERIYAFKEYIVVLDRSDNMIHLYYFDHDKLLEFHKFSILDGCQDFELLHMGFAVCGGDRINIYNVNGYLQYTIEAPNSRITAIELLETDKLAALTLSASTDEQKVVIWDINKISAFKTVPIQAEPSDRMLAISNNIVATYHSERYGAGVSLWNLDTGIRIAHWENAGSVCRVGNRLLVASVKDQFSVNVFG